MSGLPPYANHPTSYDDLDTPAQPTAASGHHLTPSSHTAQFPQSSSGPAVPAYLLPPGVQAPQSSIPGSSFASYSELVGRAPLRNLDVYARAPWFFPAAVSNEDIIGDYVVAGRLPDGLPWFALYTTDWLSHCALPDSAISRHHGESMAEARRQFVRLVYLRMRRVIGTVPLNGDWGFDTWYARTGGEAYFYAENLAHLDVRQWRAVHGVSSAALCFDSPQLRAEFRYLRKRDISYWDYPRWERRTRSRLGYLVPYQMLEIDRARYRSRVGRYIPIPRHWHEIESPRGCAVELPPALTYVGSLLTNDPFSGYWVVVYTEFIAKMAAYVLWDVYDTYRLWYMSPTARRYARELDLSSVLGSRANQEEFCRLMDVIDQINWNLVPAGQAARGAHDYDHSPGRNSPGGDFVWYDPWTSQHIDGAQAKHLRENPRAMPPTQPTGYMFEPAPVNSGALVGELEASEAETGSGGEAMEVPPPYAGHDVEPSPASMQTPAPMPSQPSGTANEGELGMLRQFLLDAGIPADKIPSGRQQMLNLVRLRMIGGRNTNA